MSNSYDALLLISFGAPERPEDVIPFLENLLEGKDVPRARMQEVAARYELFDGASPLNAQNRSLVTALIAELRAHGLEMPVYWGNRNWHPLLAEAVHQMSLDGVRRAVAFVTSGFGSYSGCRAYLEDIEQAQRKVGPDAPQIDKLRLFYNHPGFIEAMADRVADAFSQLPADHRKSAHLIFTAHSIPVAMAQRCPYEEQLREACRLVSERLNRTQWQLAYQSRSGSPAQPWLEPDLADLLRQSAAKGEPKEVVIAPIGFVSEHMETAFDLDIAAAELCHQLGLTMVRAATVGCHPRFVQMICQLILERTDAGADREALGDHGPSPDICPQRCCLTERPS